MSFITDIANILFIVLAVAGGVLALVFHNRSAATAERVAQLESELQSQENTRATLQAELAQRRKDIDRLASLAENAGVDRARLESARSGEAAPAARSDKKKANERLQRDTQRLRELEMQADEARRQLEQSQRLLKQRDADVRGLKEEVEALQVALADSRPAARPASEDREEAPPPPRVAPAAPPPPPAPSEADIEAIVKARLVEAREQVDAAERSVRDARGRANLAELETSRTQERLTRLDKRSHEILERLITTEREYRKVQRQVNDYQRMYLGIKGRFEVARDTLVSFRDRFGVEIPTEVGVPLHGPIDDFLEYDEDEERSRPRANVRRGHSRSDGHRAEAAHGASHGDAADGAGDTEARPSGTADRPARPNGALPGASSQHEAPAIGTDMPQADPLSAPADDDRATASSPSEPSSHGEG